MPTLTTTEMTTRTGLVLLPLRRTQTESSLLTLSSLMILRVPLNHHVVQFSKFAHCGTLAQTPAWSHPTM